MTSDNTEINSWDDVFQFTWDNTFGEVFVPFEKNGYLHYYFEKNPSHIIKWINLSDNSWYYFNYYKKVGNNPHYCFIGPRQPPPSPLILKIKTMEKRFKERSCQQSM